MNMCYMEEPAGMGFKHPRRMYCSFFSVLSGLLAKAKFLDSTDATTPSVTQTFKSWFPTQQLGGLFWVSVLWSLRQSSVHLQENTVMLQAPEKMSPQMPGRTLPACTILTSGISMALLPTSHWRSALPWWLNGKESVC